MERNLVYVSRLVRLPLLDADGGPIARVVDVVVAPAVRSAPPRVNGLVGLVGRRRFFVSVARIGEIGVGGVPLRSGSIDVRHFEQREGELLALGDLVGRRAGQEIVQDVGIAPAPLRPHGWDVATVALRPPRGLRRRGRNRVVGWQEVASIFDVGDAARELAMLRELHPSDVADLIRRLPLERRRRLAEAMDDERLADVLEELPEEEQLALIGDLDVERLADVIEEMDPDDAADLLAGMPELLRFTTLEAMDDEEARPIRRLLSYRDDTAGGLMTSEPLVVAPETTVAEALARIRNSDLPPALAAQVFVTLAPQQTPTGAYVGTVGFQRLLREPPGMIVAKCVEDGPPPIRAELSEAKVAEQFAFYDMVAVPVCDEAGRLLGAVTVDDVLDHVLPDDWRGRRS